MASVAKIPTSGRGYNKVGLSGCPQEKSFIEHLKGAKKLAGGK
jgi:hypothetical protein